MVCRLNRVSKEERFREEHEGTKLTDLELGGVEVDPDDLGGAGCPAAHCDGEPDSAQAPDSTGGPWFYLGRVQSRAIARGYTASQQANLIEGSCGVHLKIICTVVFQVINAKRI